MSAVLAHGRRLAELDERLRLTLPPAWRKHIRLADIRGGRAVILAPTPAWAARLRLTQTQLLATLRALGARASTVTVKVATPLPVPREPAERKPLPLTAAIHLRKAAASLTDPELKALFLNMAVLAEISDSSAGEG